MSKIKSFLSEDKDVITANKKYSLWSWIASIGALATAITTILLEATIFINDPNAQMVITLGGAIAVITILVLGSISMTSANEEYMRAAQSALRRHMAEQFSRLYRPRS